MRATAAASSSVSFTSAPAHSASSLVVENTRTLSSSSAPRSRRAPMSSATISEFIALRRSGRSNRSSSIPSSCRSRVRVAIRRRTLAADVRGRQTRDMAEFEERVVRRREALIAMGALGAGAVLLGCGTDAPTEARGASCTLTPEATEGPYWVDLDLTRRDVRDGRKGLPLLLTMTVENTGCSALRGADVEIWHADAGGVYSAVQG